MATPLYLLYMDTPHRIPTGKQSVDSVVFYVGRMNAEWFSISSVYAPNVLAVALRQWLANEVGQRSHYMVQRVLDCGSVGGPMAELVHQ
jgi:hypothetical protein